MERSTVYGVYLSVSELVDTVKKLRAVGISQSDINIYFPEGPKSAKNWHYQLHTNVKTGAIFGGLIGLVLGLVFSVVIATRENALFGIESAFSGWFLFGICLAVVAFGVIYGMSGGALVGIGTPDTAPQRYHQYLKDGATLLSVHVSDLAKISEIRKIISSQGGEDVASGNDSSVVAMIRS